MQVKSLNKNDSLLKEVKPCLIKGLIAKVGNIFYKAHTCNVLQTLV